MRTLFLVIYSPLIVLSYFLYLASAPLGGEEVERILDRFDSLEKTIGEIRRILSGQFELKKAERHSPIGKQRCDNGTIQLDLDVSDIQFKQKKGAFAGPRSRWGWVFAYRQGGGYNEESRELVQALEQYGAVQVGKRIYSLGGTDRNLINFKEASQ